MEIGITVRDELLSDFGALHIQEFLQRQLRVYELQLSALKISKYLKAEEEVNWEQELENARQEAWAEYAPKFLNKEDDE